MRSRVILVIVSLAMLLLPSAVHAQTDGSPASEDLARGLLEGLCAASTADESALTACLLAVSSVLGDGQDEVGPDAPEPLVEPPVAETDVRSIIEEALAAAQDVDLEAALEEALAAAQDVDLEAALEDSVRATRDVIDAAQRWAQDNPETVCKGGSLSVGTGAAAVVAFLTGSPGLAMRAFEEGERISNDICVDIAQ
jgi:septal ring-binding cell division protein DamX